MTTVISKPRLLETYLPDIQAVHVHSVGHLGCHFYKFEDKLSLPKEVVCNPLMFKIESDELRIKEILTELCYKILRLRPDSYLREGDYLVPYYQQEPIHLSPAEHNFFQDINLDDFAGYRVLFCNPLIWKALETAKYVKPEVVGGLVVIKDRVSSLYDPEYQEDLLFALDSTLDNLSDRGYTAFPLDSDSTYLELVREISRVWNFHQGTIGNSLVIQSPQFFGCTLKNWMKRAIEQCMNDKLPIVHFSGSWADMMADNKTLAKLKYLAHLAYLECIKVNAFLEPFTKDIQIMSDLSLAVPFFSSTEYQIFLETFETKLGDLDQLTVAIYGNNDHATRVKKWIDQNYPKARTLIIGSKAVVSNAYFDPSNNDLVNITGDEALRLESLSSPSWINRVTGLEVDHQTILPEDLNIKFDKYGVVVADTRLIRIIQPITPEDNLEEFRVKFELKWWQGYFVTTWGNMYQHYHYNRSVVYFKNYRIFNNLSEAINWLRV